MADNNKLDLRRRLARWMVGRNGTDELAMASVWVAIILYLVSVVTRLAWPNWLSLALLLYAALRMSSRSLAARQRENRAFLAKVGPLGPWLRDPAASLAEARAYKHFRCPSCGQRVRVPRGRGKIRVSCPKCHGKFEATS